MSNTDILKEHKLLDSFSESTKYIPEQYSEVITDTLLSNGFKVKVKYYVDMENSILKFSEKNSLSNKLFYRNNIINISIKK